MDLRSGCPYWQLQGSEFPPYPKLDRDQTCDIAIIGGGITGALVAHYLADTGLSCVLVDRRQPGRGSTMASTGLLQYELDTPLGELIKLVGKQNAQRSYQLCVGAFEKFEQILDELGDPCGYSRCPSLYLASSENDVAELRDEFNCRREAGIELDYLSENDIRRRFGFSRPAALYSHVGAQVDPYRLNQRLLQRAHLKGLQIFADTQIVRYDSQKDRVKLLSDHGPSIQARRIIFATGYETPQFLDQSIVTLKSTYALASLPIEQPIKSEKCVIWETSRPYFYIRWGEQNRVMLGGEDEPFVDPAKRDALIQVKAEALQQKFQQMFGIKIQIDCAWAGTFGETKDGLPYIGPHEKFPHGLFALGYGGNGITFSLIAGEIIRDLLLERPNPDAKIFTFSR